MVFVVEIPGDLREWTIEVTCMSVVGQQATIGGRVTRYKSSAGTPNQERGWLFEVADNDIVGNPGSLPDTFNLQGLLEAPQVCPAPTFGSPITEGDFVVEQN